VADAGRLRAFVLPAAAALLLAGCPLQIFAGYSIPTFRRPQPGATRLYLLSLRREPRVRAGFGLQPRERVGMLLQPPLCAAAERQPRRGFPAGGCTRFLGRATCCSPLGHPGDPLTLTASSPPASRGELKYGGVAGWPGPSPFAFGVGGPRLETSSSSCSFLRSALGAAERLVSEGEDA